MPGREDWDPARYEGSHSFVWHYGESVLELLAPEAGERIVDIGCGTGHLTARIAEAGAEVLGIDPSPAMIAQARQNYPNLKFELIPAEKFTTGKPFDAAFSNAALHWILDPEPALIAIASALKPGARFVAEMGGKGNIRLIDGAIETSIRNYYPSIGEYATLLEKHGLEVRQAWLFDRPTPLDHGESGLHEWLKQFRPDNKRPIEEVEADLRPHLLRDGQWFADYRRLRFVAVKAK